MEQRNEVQECLNNDSGIATPVLEVGDVADPGLGGVGNLDDLMNVTNWNNVTPNVAVTGSMTSQTNVVGDVPLQFYRVMLLPAGP